MLRFAQHDIDGIGRICHTGADGVLSTFSLRLCRAEIFVLLEKVLPQESLKNQMGSSGFTVKTYSLQRRGVHRGYFYSLFSATSAPPWCNLRVLALK